MERSSGVIAENGGLTSHTAVVAIHFGIPAILGVKNITNLLEDGDTITLDPLGGIIYKGEAKVL